jgi:hypothetical protein
LHLYLANHRENVLSSMTVSREAILEQSTIRGASTTLSQYDPSLLPPSMPSETRPVRVRFDGQYLDRTTTPDQQLTLGAPQMTLEMPLPLSSARLLHQSPQTTQINSE